MTLKIELVVGAIVLTGVMYAGVTSLNRDEQVRDLDAKYMSSEAGKFAIQNYRDCRYEPLFGRAKSSAECINQVIDGAEKLHGDIFAEQVKKTLANRLAEK